MIDPFHPIRISSVVCHRSNKDILFVVYGKSDVQGYYRCKRLDEYSSNNIGISDFSFSQMELDVLEFKSSYRRWGEYDVVAYKSNPEIKMISLENIERGKTKCRWVIKNKDDIITVREFEFEDLELNFEFKE